MPTDSCYRTEKRKPRNLNNLALQRKSSSRSNKRYLPSLGPSSSPLVSHNESTLLAPRKTPGGCWFWGCDGPEELGCIQYFNAQGTLVYSILVSRFLYVVCHGMYYLAASRQRRMIVPYPYSCCIHQRPVLFRRSDNLRCGESPFHLHDPPSGSMSGRPSCSMMKDAETEA